MFNHYVLLSKQQLNHVIQICIKLSKNTDRGFLTVGDKTFDDYDPRNCENNLTTQEMMRIINKTKYP